MLYLLLWLELHPDLGDFPLLVLELLRNELIQCTGLADGDTMGDCSGEVDKEHRACFACTQVADCEQGRDVLRQRCWRDIPLDD